MHNFGRQIGPANERAVRRGEAARNLVLVHEPFIQEAGDLEKIAAEVSRIAPDIEVFIASNDIPSSATRKLASRRPTLVYSPTELRSFRPLRGKIYSGALIAKDTQLRRLAEAGVAVPHHATLTGGLEVRSEEFGAVAIIKPTGFSSHGRGTTLVPTADLASTRWRQHPAARPDGAAPKLIQRFIDTGEYPSHYRILTLFGEPIFAFLAVSTVARPALDSGADVLARGPFMAKHGQRRLSFQVEGDVLDAARKTFDAIPEVALHGCDVIRDAATGALFVLEINPGGNTWSFSSQWAAMLRDELKTPDLARQFSAWTTCARVLVERTRLEAV